LKTRLTATLIALCLASPVAAHDFWLQPHAFRVNANADVPVTIQVGHGSLRQRWAGDPARVVFLRSLGADGVADLRQALRPATSPQDALVRFAKPGTYVLAFQSTPAASNLPAIRFNDYLNAEGLTPALQLRARTNAAGSPGKETYSRRCKAIVEVGADASRGRALVTKPLGMSLEIVPEKNPYLLRPNERLPVRVLFEGRPLAGALVKLTNLEFDGRPVETHLTTPDGRASFAVPHTGEWLVNVIWTKPITGNPEADFETTFSSLTFGFSRQ
jgi:uncharacterized GH25 family protein